MIKFQQIGTIHSPFKETAGMPIQPAGAEGVCGTIEILPEFSEGLKDLEGFSHLILIYHFHQVRERKLSVTPFMDTKKRGVFATRAPMRPNPIGLSIVKLLTVKGNKLDIENVDMLDNTPLLDIKPYVPEFDHQQEVRTGWLEKFRNKVHNHISDDRFKHPE
ncbi:MAG: tRNA (N6-threonylcarbamoyladenosine(37)-N6)-methyltransferase TrmO [Desulfobulbaceae bacterium]|nr:tRNA (N6-threonylcarbamoyladenosine(37)-N6)-methyltransferase TrmO [Desulfobulbaceae bacterium]